MTLRASVSNGWGLMLRECVWAKPEVGWSPQTWGMPGDTCLQFLRIATGGQACTYWEHGSGVSLQNIRGDGVCKALGMQ